MSPVVIADSDDDDCDERGYSAPLSPNHSTPVIDAPTRSSDGASHVSTDPAFVQSIFNEQRDAANQRTQVAQGEGMMQDKSSVTSATEPFDPKDHKVPGMTSMSDITRVTTPRNDTTTSKQTAELEEVWDVPNSPERRPTWKGSKKKSDRTSKTTTTVKMTRGLRNTLEKLGYRSEDEDDEAISGHQSISTRGKKRRKLGSPGGSLRDPNDVSLIIVPRDDDKDSTGSVQGKNNTASGALVATLSVDSDSSFLVGPKPLSACQKLEYQSITPVPSSPPVGHLGLQAADVGSTGTATNINTPRRNLPSSHDVGLRTKTPENEAIRNARRTRSPRRRRYSSPDVLVHPNNGSASAGAQPPTQSCTNGTPSDGILLNGEGEEYQAEVIPEDGNEDSDFAVPEKPVRAKRQRGRPRKSAKVPDNTATCGETGNGSAAKAKKKRGRPKKSGPSAAAEQVPPGEDVPAEAGARVATTVDEAMMAGRHVGDGDVGNEKSKPATTQVANTGQGWAATGKACQITVSSDRAKEDPSSAMGPTVTGDQDRNDSKRPSRPEAGAKPAYRVGLSKRRKIAPLLKSLRK
ncbi:Uncharacterized protein TCAP_04930 [Tolypocladium capitatum]|uniref:AT hook domain-containing protein n=1 Tax=Tolypocladium capitatum TaxID=45235 RepID=A0A2K3QC79_9HYPO|nr:Uncharacterized protein TCAP_04930 [Tolypocladium capitatum]